MTSKQKILERIRNRSLPASPLPTLDGEWIAYDDPVRQFSEVLASVGGKTVVAPNETPLENLIRGLPCLQAALASGSVAERPIVCALPEVALGNLDLNQIDDPHELETVEVAIMPGQFAVAENGAVWVANAGVRHRAIYFIAQHLVLTVPITELVCNMHQAYQRLSFDAPSYGVFISGPSKTADIEQSLVIGAHGARSLTVILTGPRSAS